MKPMISLAMLLSLAFLASGQTYSPPGTSEPPADPRSPPGAPTMEKSGKGAPKTGPARPARSGLEKALEEALKNNPDLRVAAAKASEAEAVLARARLQVTQKVVTAYQTVELTRATSDVAQAQLTRLRQLKAKMASAVSQDDVTRAETELTAARAKLATAEADLDYLLGRSAARTAAALNAAFGLGGGSLVPNPNALGLYERGLGGYSSSGPATANYFYGAPWAGLSTAQSGTIPATDKLRAILDRRITVKFSDVPASDVLKWLTREAQGLHLQANLKDEGWKEKITASLTDVPFGAALQLLEDTLPDHRIVVRSYGMLIAKKDQVPAGGVLLDDFRLSGGVREAAPNSLLRKAIDGTEANPPKGKVEGLVTRVGEGGLVTVSVGSDAGVVKGHTLEVFRLGTAPRYLGRLRIVDGTAKEAVGKQIVGGTKETIKVGDRVASQVTGSK
jgi:hypothetical protein